MARTFQARYPGRCGACDDPIREGERVRYDDDDELIHEHCDAPSLPHERDAAETVCQGCWMVHTGECL